MNRSRGARAAAVAALAVIAAGIAVAWPFRGLALSHVWLLEATERYAAWMRVGGAPAMRAAFGDPNGVLPLVPWAAAALCRALGAEPLTALRLLAGGAAATSVVAVFVVGRRFGGTPVGLAAAAALLAQPRFLATATSASPTIFAVAAVAALFAATLEARDRPTAAPWLVAVGALALATSVHAWFAMLPLAYLVIVKAGPAPTPGHVAIRATPLWMLAMPLVWVALLVGAVPFLHRDIAERLGQLLGAWLQRPGDPFLYAGTLYGARRLALDAPLALWAWTTPAAVLMPAIAGALGVILAPRRLSLGDAERPLEARQIVATSFVAAWLVPVLLRSPYHGGVDLLAFGTLPVAWCAGVTLALAWRALVRRGGVIAAATLVLASAAAAVDVGVSTHGRLESYYSPLLGGVHRAVDVGHARTAHAPASPSAFDALPARDCRVALLSNAWELRPVFERYRQMGVVPDACTLVEAADANVFVLVHDDTLPELYGQVLDFSRLVDGADMHVDDVRGIPLVSVAVLR